MNQMTIRTFQATDQMRVIALWRECGLVVPQNDPAADIARKLAWQPDLFFVGESGGEIVATVMAGYEGHRGWINYLAVARAWQRAGYGRGIMRHAEQVLRSLGCPKINLQVRSTNSEVIRFYERLGFGEDAVVSMGKRLVLDASK